MNAKTLGAVLVAAVVLASVAFVGPVLAHGDAPTATTNDPTANETPENGTQANGPWYWHASGTWPDHPDGWDHGQWPVWMAGHVSQDARDWMASHMGYDSAWRHEGADSESSPGGQADATFGQAGPPVGQSESPTVGQSGPVYGQASPGDGHMMGPAYGWGTPGDGRGFGTGPGAWGQYPGADQSVDRTQSQWGGGYGHGC